MFRFYNLGFSSVFPPGACYFSFWTSDSDSSSKTVYMTKFWSNSDFHVLSYVHFSAQVTFLVFIIQVLGILDMSSCLYIQFLMRNPNLRSKNAKFLEPGGQKQENLPQEFQGLISNENFFIEGESETYTVFDEESESEGKND